MSGVVCFRLVVSYAVGINPSVVVCAGPRCRCAGGADARRGGEGAGRGQDDRAFGMVCHFSRRCVAGADAREADAVADWRGARAGGQVFLRFALLPELGEGDINTEAQRLRGDKMKRVLSLWVEYGLLQSVLEPNP